MKGRKVGRPLIVMAWRWYPLAPGTGAPNEITSRWTRGRIPDGPSQQRAKKQRFQTYASTRMALEGFHVGTIRLETEPGGHRSVEHRPVHAAARDRRLPRAGRPLDGGHRVVLERGGRGSRHRVLPAVRRDAGHEPRHSLVALVCRAGRSTWPTTASTAMPDRRVATTRPSSGKGKGDRPPAHLRRAARRDLPARRRTPAAGDRPGRRGRLVPADGAGGGGRVSGLRQDRRDRRPDLLRLRRAGGRGPAGGRPGQGPDHGRYLVPTRQGDSLEPVATEAADGLPERPPRDRRPPTTRAWSTTAARADGHLDWDELVAAESGRVSVRAARPGSPVDDRLHVGHDGRAQGGGPRPRRVSGQDRAGGRAPGRHARGRPSCTG